MDTRATTYQCVSSRKVSRMNARFAIAKCLILAAVTGCSQANQAAAPADPTEAGETSSERPAVGGALRADPSPIVLIRTSEGTIKLRLDPAKAPLTVDNFLRRSTAAFTIRPSFIRWKTAMSSSVVAFKAIWSSERVDIAFPMKRTTGWRTAGGQSPWRVRPTRADSGTGQFFINVADNPDLDRRGETPDQCGYCVFGEVVEGLDTIDRIAQTQTHKVGDFAKLPVRTVLIEGATKVR